MKAGTDHKNNKIKQSQELADAFMLINTDERIGEQAMTLYEIYRNTEAKDTDRINAIRLIWEYAMVKPKQKVDVTSDGKSITGYSFEVVRPTDGNQKD